MALYLLQLRHLKLKSGAAPNTFPAPAHVIVTFGPEDAFGVESSGVRTTVPRARPASILWDANEGTTSWNAEFIDQVNATLTFAAMNAEIVGNRLMLKCPVGSFEEAVKIVTSASQILPALLSLHLRTFVWIKKFMLDLGEGRYNFEVIEATTDAVIAEADENSVRTVAAIEQWLNTRDDLRRFITAFYYFRNAQRYAMLEPDRHATVAEVTLNLTKALDVLCSGNRDALRVIGNDCGVDPVFIEERIVPLLLIRNYLDVAHVALGPFTSSDRDTILMYVRRAIVHVREFLVCVGDAVKAGKVQLDPIPTSLDRDKQKLIAKLAAYASR